MAYFSHIEGNECWEYFGSPWFEEVSIPGIALVEDLGEVKMEESGKSITYQVHDYDGLYTFEEGRIRSDR